MPTRRFTLEGQVVDADSGAGQPDLTVKAIGANVTPPDRVFAEARTDASGAFELAFTDLDLQAYFRTASSAPSALFFEVYGDASLIESTRQRLTWSPPPGADGAVFPVVIPVIQADEVLTVRGRVLESSGSPPEAPLLVRAFDVRLRDEALLGEGRTAADGSYQIRYRRRQLERGRAAADLIVRVFSGPSERRPVVSSPLVLEALHVEQIDLALGEQAFRGLSKHAELSAKLAAAVSDDALGDLDARRVALVARRTGLTIRDVGHLARAQELERRTRVPAAVFVGLFSQGSPTDLSGLLAGGRTVLGRHIRAAIDANVIGAEFGDRVNEFLGRLEEVIIDEELAERPDAPDHATLGTVLSSAGLDQDHQRVLLRAWLDREDETLPEFWAQVAGRAGLQAREIEAVQRAAQMAVVSLGHRPMMEALLRRSELRDARDLVTLELADWQELARTMDPPMGIDGDNVRQRRDNYAAAMMRLVVRSFPTARTAHRLSLEPGFDGDDFRVFFEDNPDFDLSGSSVSRYLHAHPRALERVREPAALTGDLEGVQRLFGLVSADDKAPVVAALWRRDLRSAHAVARRGPAFVRDLGVALGQEQAQVILAAARRTVALSVATLAKFSPLFDLANPSIPGEVVHPELPPGLPDWATLFGSADFCECEHCRSVLSPAAYLVDLLQFLENASAGAEAALAALLARRPDLAHVRLDCANTNTALPYVDLVNEVLENAVVNGPFSLAVAGTPQTTATAEELRANPEHILPAAYDALAQDSSTWSLPFDLWHEERRLYLDHLGMKVHELMDVLHREGQPPEAIDRAAASLSMTDRERRIIAGETGDHGLGTSDAVLTLLRRSGLTYPELEDLLTSRYINPGETAVQFEGQSCSLGDATLELTSPERDRLHRFRRLQVITGWPTFDQDLAIEVLAAGDLDDAFLIQVAYLKRLLDRLKRPMPEILAWWAPISTRGQGERESLYDSLFLNPTVNNPLSPVQDIFRLTAQRTELAETDRRFLDSQQNLDPEITPLVLAAVNVTADELRRLLRETLPDGRVNIANLSHLYRVAAFSRSLGLTVADYLALARLTGRAGIAAFDLPGTAAIASSPEETWGFVELRDQVAASGFAIAELEYLLAHRHTPAFPLPLSSEAEDIVLDELRAELGKLRPAPGLTPAQRRDFLADKLALVVPDPALAMAIVENRSELDDAAQAAVIEEHFAEFLDVAEAVERLVGAGELVGEPTRVDYVLGRLAAHLSRNLAVRQIAAAAGIEIEVCERLLTQHLTDPFDGQRPALEALLSDGFVQGEAASASAAAAVLRRIAKLALPIARLGIASLDADFVLGRGPGIGWYALAALPVEPLELGAPVDLAGWLRLAGTFRLGRDLFGSTLSIPSLLDRVHQAATDRAALLDLVSQHSGWDRDSLEFLLGSGGYDVPFPEGFRDEQWLARLRQAFGLIARAGVSASQIWDWSAPEATAELARRIKNAAKARYDSRQWLEVAPKLSDDLRVRRRDALTDLLIARHGQFEDAAHLYQHFLIDVEMSPCFLTSRIKQAIASVQLFVQRALMGLEGEVRLDREDAQQWAWRKSYRVWEANRNVFMFPENFLEPELRRDRTPLFIELVDRLMQEEPTGEAVERAYLGYLRRLDDVARLEVCGVYHDQDEDVLHILARSRGVPAVYWYRQWVDQEYFTPWERVEITIDGEHVLPVVYNRRLWVLWLTFSDKTSEQESGLGDSAENPERYHEIRVAWSERRDGKWSSPRTSAKAIPTSTTYMAIEFVHGNTGRFYFWADVQGGTLSVYPFFHYSLSNPYFSTQPNRFFRFEGCGEEPRVIEDRSGVNPGVHARLAIPYRVPRGTYSDAMRFRQSETMTMFSHISVGPSGTILSATSKIETLLNSAPKEFLITPPHQYLHFYSQAPFFYEDSRRAFLVVPESVYGNGDSRGPETVMLERDHLDLGLVEAVRSARLARGNLQPTAVQALVVPRALEEGRVFTVADEALVIQRDGLDAAPSEDDRGGELVLMSAVSPDLTPGPAAGEYKSPVTVKKAYRFHTFYHPYACLFIEEVNRFGVDGLLRPEPNGKGLELYRQLTPGSSFRFSAEYGPQSPVPFQSPQEDIDFTAGGAYSQYNWELFFHIPMAIAQRLSQNQKFAEAQRWHHAIFDPTEPRDPDLAADQQHRRFWKLKPFFTFGSETRLEEVMARINAGDPDYLTQVHRWEADPFDPHLVARLRIGAYMKHVVMRYLDNLIAWGDHLFAQDTIEAINEATQLYVLAAQILGRRPEQVRRREPAARSWSQLRPLLDEFSNALVTIETVLTYHYVALPAPGLVPPAAASSATLKTTLEKTSGAVAMLASAFVTLAAELDDGPPAALPRLLYFCLPANDKLLGYWDTVADRLFKIRNCMNIEGVVRALALFEPPIDPALLVRAAAAGVDLASALDDLNAPLPPVRFASMQAKALELCGDVKALGGALLAALEKRDGEELALIRAGHEVAVLKSARRQKERSIEEARHAVTALQWSRQNAHARQAVYAARSYTNEQERLHLDKLEEARGLQEAAEILNMIASFAHLIPDFSVGVSGIASPVATAAFGGTSLGNHLRAASTVLSFVSGRRSHEGARALVKGGYDRRREDWQLQSLLGHHDTMQADEQILAAEVRVAVAEHDLALHDLQVANTQTALAAMTDKYTNQELYGWMIGQLSTLYFQSYQLAYDLAKRAERCYRHELGVDTPGFIVFGYWDSLKKGLLAGERLHRDLRRMEVAYLEENRRELEITKQVSVQRLDPAALIGLRQTGACEVEIPEVLFDLDFPGHYLRRLRSVSISIPCVVGPYSGVHATLTLLEHRTRVSTVDRHLPYAGPGDTRFVTGAGGLPAIATSRGQSDSGLFELSFRDERYLPFEGAGAIGRWRIELPAEFRAFDYDTISDVILHLSYTARDGGRAVAQQVVPVLHGWINDAVNATQHTGLYHAASLRREFGAQYHRFLNPEGAADHATTLAVRREHFPYLFTGRELDVDRAILVLVLRDPDLYDGGQPLAVELTRAGGAPSTADLLVAGEALGGLPHAEHTSVAGPVAAEEAWTLRVPPSAVAALPAALRRVVAVDGQPVPRLDASQFEDIGILLHYHVGELGG